MKYSYGAPNGTIVAGTTGINGSGLNQFSTWMNLLYVDSSQTLYVGDMLNQRVMRWTNGASSGSVVAGTGSNGTSLNQVSQPWGVWIDSSSNLFVTDAFNQRVTRWALGATSGVLVAGITGLSGIKLEYS